MWYTMRVHVLDHMPKSTALVRADDSPGGESGRDGHGGAGERHWAPHRGRRWPLPRVHARHEGNSNDIA